MKNGPCGIGVRIGPDDCHYPRHSFFIPLQRRGFPLPQFLQTAREYFSGNLLFRFYERRMYRKGSLDHLIAFSPEEAFQAKKKNYESLVFQHTPGLLGCAFRLTRSAAEAEDLVQDALLRAWQYWDGYEQGSNCRAWLYRILINVFRRSLDKPERKNLHLSTDLPELTNVLQFEHKFELDEHGVREAFSRIPREFQEVIELVLIEEFSYKEAAEILEVPMGTVMSRLFRGRQKMQSLLRAPTSREASSNG